MIMKMALDNGENMVFDELIENYKRHPPRHYRVNLTVTTMINGLSAFFFHVAVSVVL